MADKKPDDPKTKALEKVLAKAEELLRPPAGGYNREDEHYNEGVQAVIDLLKAAL